ncbi:MAG: hypothetical protein AB9866_08605 [Syntrophobacteraceae bacterium]
MAIVFDINECRRRLTAKKGFGPWSRRFNLGFNDTTSIRELDNEVVKYLIHGGDDSAIALYELIMGVKGLGQGTRFYYLDNDNKMAVTDITLFLLDQLRFEAMFRLGWLNDYPTLIIPLLDLIQGFKAQFSAARHQSPVLSAAHPRYREYLSEYEGDRNSFVRKLIPDAIQIFSSMQDDAEQ